MNEISNKYKLINTPDEFLEFLSENINYGYLGKSGRVFYYDDNDFNDKWFDEYILQSKDDLLNTGYGNCWDLVELERDWFLSHGYEIKTIYQMVNLDYDNCYPTHSFLVYKDKDGSWNWFEFSDFINRGIHKFSSFDELLKYKYDKYVEFLKTFDITEEELNKIVVTEFQKVKEHISVLDYLDCVLEGIEM